MEDSDIIDLYFLRDEKAIKETDEKYGKRLLSFSTAITEDLRDAEECVNDTYLKTWNSIPPTRPDNFFAFLLKIIRNLSLDVCDRKNAQKRNAVLVELSDEMSETVPSYTMPDEEIRAEELGRSIDSFLRAQKEGVRIIFVKRYFYTESVAKIASESSLSEANVKSILFRTRKKLKKHLEKEGYDI
ncbi:MAG: RNA polymerase sigma factor [Ruminococcaceae bacterium]|nr:RNA polymerase sigma factor [Oscillospiraceae bacterium]